MKPSGLLPADYQRLDETKTDVLWRAEASDAYIWFDEHIVIRRTPCGVWVSNTRYRKKSVWRSTVAQRPKLFPDAARGVVRSITSQVLLR